MVEGAVAELMFAAVALAFTFTLRLVFTLALATGPRAHALAAIATPEIANTSIKTGGLTSAFFIWAFSEAAALSRDVIYQGVKGKEDRIAPIRFQDNDGPQRSTQSTN